MGLEINPTDKSKRGQEVFFVCFFLILLFLLFAMATVEFVQYKQVKIEHIATLITLLPDREVQLQPWEGNYSHDV